MRLLSFFLFLICFFACPAMAEQVSATKPTYSRELILPLVSKAGKKRGLFSKVVNGKKATWNKNFWGATFGFDQFTGIGWGTPKAGALITPQHIVCARHHPVNSVGVHFYGENGAYLGKRVPARDSNNKRISAAINPDIMLVKLSEPAPQGAKVYSLPNPETYLQRIDWSKLPLLERPLLLATDWRNPAPKSKNGSPKKSGWIITRSAHVVTYTLASQTTRSLTWTHGPKGNPKIHSAYHETINRGDSGHPVFWVTRSGLVLASHFTGVGGGPDYGHPDIQKELQAAIDKLGGEKPYKLKTAPVP